jgi:hypothetical protein
MAEPLSLMEFLQALLTDAGLRGGFGDDPQGTLAAHGLADLTPADVHDALVLVQDTQTVDYSLDLATAAAPPPPPAGDGHEAAVEYLARYLAAPQGADPAERWTDLDDDLGDAAVGGFGTGDDTAYGIGSDTPADDGWSHFAAEPDPGPDDRAGHGHAELDDLRDLDEFDEFDGLTGLTDLSCDVPDAYDGESTPPEGA